MAEKHTFEISVKWEVAGYVQIEAESLDAAIEEISDLELHDFDSEYIDESFEVDFDMIRYDNRSLIKRIEEEKKGLEDPSISPSSK